MYEDSGANNKKIFYYVFELTENKFEHLFEIMNSVGDVKVTATSTAKVVYEIPEPPKQDEALPEIENDLPKLKAENVISGNWELEAARSRKKWKTPTENLDNFFVKNAAENFYDNNKIWLNYNQRQIENR